MSKFDDEDALELDDALLAALVDLYNATEIHYGRSETFRVMCSAEIKRALSAIRKARQNAQKESDQSPRPAYTNGHNR